MNETQDYMERGIKLGATLGAIVALRGIFKGSRQAGKGIYRRANKLRGSRGRI
jgi:hypothetical protein